LELLDKGTLAGKRVLIVGADAAVGSALHARLVELEVEVTPTTRRQPLKRGWVNCDLSTIDETWLPPAPVDVAFLCAAYARLKFCEDDPEQSRGINVNGILQIAKNLTESGTFVVFLSTNQALGGQQPNLSEDAPYKPINEYGRQKAEVEQRLLERGKTIAIARLTKVLSPNDPLFSQWKLDLEKGKPIMPFTDMAFAGVSMECALKSLICIGGSQEGGMWHVSAPNDVSYVDVAEYLALLWGQDTKLIRPVSALDCGIPQSFLPKFSSLNSSRLKNSFGIIPAASLAMLSEIFH